MFRCVVMIMKWTDVMTIIARPKRSRRQSDERLPNGLAGWLTIAASIIPMKAKNTNAFLMCSGHIFLISYACASKSMIVPGTKICFLSALAIAFNASSSRSGTS